MFRNALDGRAQTTGISQRVKMPLPALSSRLSYAIASQCGVLTGAASCHWYRTNIPEFKDAIIFPIGATIHRHYLSVLLFALWNGGHLHFK